MTVSTLVAPLCRVAPQSLAGGLRVRLATARAHRSSRATAADHRLPLALAAAPRRSH